VAQVVLAVVGLVVHAHPVYLALHELAFVLLLLVFVEVLGALAVHVVVHPAADLLAPVHPVLHAEPVFGAGLELALLLAFTAFVFPHFHPHVLQTVSQELALNQTVVVLDHSIATGTVVFKLAELVYLLILFVFLHYQPPQSASLSFDPLADLAIAIVPLLSTIAVFVAFLVERSSVSVLSVGKLVFE